MAKTIIGISENVPETKGNMVWYFLLQVTSLQFQQ